MVSTSSNSDAPVPWPRFFIPPSVKALRINLSEEGPPIQSLLRALPGVLAASGARLDRLEVILTEDLEELREGLAQLAQTLRCCSPTLKGFLLSAGADSLIQIDSDGRDFDRQVQQLRVQWADVLAGVSACCELQVLVLPRVEVVPLFPPGTAFGRLIHLEMSDNGRKLWPNARGIGLWEVMASGGLPALAKLSVWLDGLLGGDEEVRSRVAPGLEAVAGTLTHLCLDKSPRGEFPSDDSFVGYEFGVAVGKLRRLTDLALGLSEDGHFYHAFAQGLAASGGDGPLPLLWRVVLSSEVKTYADLVASLLLPSVRVFRSCHCDVRGALLTACALRQAGYMHIWVPGPASLDVHVQAVQLVASGSTVVLDRVGMCSWAILPTGRLPDHQYI
jgi:hypothetical protein